MVIFRHRDERFCVPEWVHLIDWLAGLSGLFFLGVLAAGLLLWWEHRLLSRHYFTRLNHAFVSLNGSVSLILGAATLFSFWP